MTIVRQTGRTLFGDNCAACHGFDAKGGKGFPNLTTASWLWGGDPETIAETIRVGINSTHPKTRVAQMLAFGRDRMLPRADVDNVVGYVRTLVRPGGVEADSTGEARSRQGDLRRQLRLLSRRRRQGEGRSRRAGPDGQVLDLWRRRPVDLDERVERPAGTHAGMGGPPRCRRPQDSRALSRRSEVAWPMSRVRDHARAETEGRDLAAGRLWPAGPRRGQRSSRLCRDDVPAGLRRSRPAGRRQAERTSGSARRNPHARPDKRRHGGSGARPTMTTIPAVVPPAPREKTLEPSSGSVRRLLMACRRLARPDRAAVRESRLRRSRLPGLDRRRRRSFRVRLGLHPVPGVSPASWWWARSSPSACMRKAAALRPANRSNCGT